MLRLHVLAKWCQQVPLVHYCQQLASTLSSHDTCFTQTADSLFFMHEGLQQARAPIFDVPSAIEVLLTRGYSRLPKCIENLGIQATLPEDQLKPALRKLNTLVRSKLLEVSLPKEISQVTVSDGTAILRVDGEFEVYLTLGYRGHLNLWRILHLKLLVGENNGLVKLEETRRYALGDDLERRMAVAENPFMILYTVLHELCIALVMDTVLRQVQILRQGRWKDAVRFELIADGNVGQGGNATSVQMAQDMELDSTGQRIPGLKIFYWLDFEKGLSGPASSSPPFIKIERGPDLKIKCLHSSFVFDPLTDKEAELSLDQSCIDVEELLLRAIACHRHTRLLEIQRELSRNVQVCQASGDVILKREGDEIDTDSRKMDVRLAADKCFGDEVLHVRAYGISYVTLGINIRNGHFLLQSTQNILAPSVLLECEEALNVGNMTATEVFISMRRKSILHLFASTGRSLGLEVYEQCLTTLRIPKSMLHGSDLLLMGFPQCGSSYYLLLQLDKDFKPLFYLLESRPEQRGKSHIISEANYVFRLNKVDINQMHVVGDESNLAILDWKKIQSVPVGASSTIAEHSLLSDFGMDSSPQLSGCSQSKFSSVVDEVFEFEKVKSGPSLVSSLFNAPSFSQLSTLSANQQGMRAGITPKLDVGMQHPQISNATKASTASLNSSLYGANNLNGVLNANSLPSSSPGRSSSIQKLSHSKSDQELSTVRSPHRVEVSQYAANDVDQSRSANDSPKDIDSLISANRPTQSLSPLRASGSLMHNVKPNSSKSLSARDASGFSKGQTSELQSSHSSGSKSVATHAKASRKRSLSDIRMLIPSLQGLEADAKLTKRRKIEEPALHHSTAPQAPLLLLTGKTAGYVYGSLLADANHGLAPSNIYVSVLLHVIKHCSLCIKHARLTSQMDALEIPYVEEIGQRAPSSNLWFRLPFARDDSWKHICLQLGKPGSMYWDVKISDPHFQELWELYKGSATTPWGGGVRIANTSDSDSHIHYDPEGVVLSYKTVEVDSIQRLVSDLQRLYNARLFACGMRTLIGLRGDDKQDDSVTKSENKLQFLSKGNSEAGHKLSEQMRKTFKIEAVGLMSLWFSYGYMPVMAHFVVEWEAGKNGCTMHVSPDHLWPHTKFLEDFINGGEVASFLDCIRLTAGPLLALAAAIPPARMSGPVSASTTSIPKQSNLIPSQGLLPSAPSTSAIGSVSSAPVGNAVASSLGSQSLHHAATLSAAIRGGSGTVPSSLLPIDVSIVLRGPYWIRIIYRKKFAVDMRCFAGDQVWLQPATPPKGGPAAGGSLPCPQFRPFIMEHVAQGLNALEPNVAGGSHVGGHFNSGSASQGPGTQPMAPNSIRPNVGPGSGMPRPNSITGSQVTGNLSRISNAILPSSGMPSGVSGVPVRAGTGVPVHVRGELNTAFIGLGDDGGYGGGWVPLAALKKVLRGILKYLGVLWLFAQLPDLLKEILGSILKESEGALLNLDQEQPALRFFVGSYVFAVSVHRVQLLLQVLSVKRFHPQQQQGQTSAHEELTSSEISEISDYFSRRVASEPYDASRVASFITLLTLPISILREFLKLISWKKSLSQAHNGDVTSAQRARIELCLENHSGDDNSEVSSASRSNIHYDRAHNSLDFALTFVLDHAHIPHINAAGGAAWLPYCVSVRLKYSFGDSTNISFLEMSGSHGGRACWSRVEDWEKCKQRLIRVVEFANGNSAGDVNQGRLRLVADALQKTLQLLLQQLRDGSLSSASIGT
ncbi:uncharacterized protein A4U43_C10F13360 [Asparagus officinalis]|uniref:Mediator of RNA polymerase II transcription subunit 14 n=1 Tax=Asparagus officinalis TaxID=4686 RepID=A0A5P1E2G0_ASPOF|nr:mediator of RNA polymerase II transcription subunit 14 isoform X2 [Asparagus officinalis]ONK56822.1 uncharacterized protein A4U43_C10F13360 [Asparagus officinalis]